MSKSLRPAPLTCRQPTPGVRPQASPYAPQWLAWGLREPRPGGLWLVWNVRAGRARVASSAKTSKVSPLRSPPPQLRATQRRREPQPHVPGGLHSFPRGPEQHPWECPGRPTTQGATTCRDQVLHGCGPDTPDPRPTSRVCSPGVRAALARVPQKPEPVPRLPRSHGYRGAGAQGARARTICAACGSTGANRVLAESV